MMKQQKTEAIKHDGLLTIAIGRSRHDKNWKNKEFLWSDLVQRLKKPKITDETLRNIKKCPKKTRTAVKMWGAL